MNKITKEVNQEIEQERGREVDAEYDSKEYMILWWPGGEDYLGFVANKDSSIRLFETLDEADDYAYKHDSANMRVISIEGVNE